MAGAASGGVGTVASVKRTLLLVAVATLPLAPMTWSGARVGVAPLSLPTPLSDHTDAAVRHAGSQPPSFRFTNVDANGRPARWNPCTQIPLLLNPSGAPAEAQSALRQAARRVSAASGLQLALVGTTAHSPDRAWGTRSLPGSSGWPPVLVAWSDPGTPELSDGGSSAVTTTLWMSGGNGELVYVSGRVVVNRAHMGLFSGAGGPGHNLTALLEHELSHLVGLGHVSDPKELMYPFVGAVGALGPGDREGLRRLGDGGCLAVPTPPTE